MSPVGTKIGIRTGIEMATETEGTHTETGRIWNEIEMICGRTVLCCFTAGRKGITSAQAT